MNGEADATLGAVLDFLAKLDQESIYYSLSIARPDFLLVSVVVPGERWEIEFGRQGDIEIEVFTSNGEIRGPAALDELFAKFTE